MSQKYQLSFFLLAFSLLVLIACSKSVDPVQNLKDGEAFLAANSAREGVVVTLSGLQYEVLREGDRKKPSDSDSVTVNYMGSLINGKEFDRGQAITFPLNAVIAGWREGLQLMNEGAKYRFFIPSELAYGKTGAGRSIAPNSALIFEVDLVKVNR